MKTLKLHRLHLLGVILAGLLLSVVFTGCYYDDPYYGYGGPPGYYAPSTYSNNTYYYSETPLYAPTYRSTVYEAPAPYYRTSPSYYYRADYNRYYGNDYYYRGGGSRYYYNENRYHEHRHHDHKENKYKKSYTYKRDYDSNVRPAEQRSDFRENAKEKGKLTEKTKDSLAADRKKEQNTEKKRRS